MGFMGGIFASQKSLTHGLQDADVKDVLHLLALKVRTQYHLWADVTDPSPSIWIVCPIDQAFQTILTLQGAGGLPMGPKSDTGRHLYHLNDEQISAATFYARFRLNYALGG